MHRTLAAICRLALAGAVAFAGPAFAQTSGGGSTDLAKQLANPVSNLISVPFQYNYNAGIGPDDGYQSYVNVQPVIPFSIAPDWNVISRTILPVVYQKDVAGSGSQFGLGATQASLFLSPKEPTAAGLIWGVGPIFTIPTSTDDIATNQWGAGPTAVALLQKGSWTTGVLANHVWTFGNDDYRAGSSSYVQPFVSYVTKKATTFTVNTETTYDWKDEEWSVPINAGVYQLIKIGKQRLQIGGGVRYWVDSPERGPDGWGARAAVTFLFPKG